MKLKIKGILVAFAVMISVGVAFTIANSNAASAKAKECTLIPGTYTVGKDLKKGRYVVSATSGSGNFFNHPKKSSGEDVNEILGSDTSAGEIPNVTADFKKGDQVEISGMTSAHFVPVKKRNKKNKTTLSTGYWVVGKDIKKGKYAVSPASGQSGNFMVTPKNPFGSDVNEVLGTDTDAGQVPKINVRLKKGDKVFVGGMSNAVFAK